MVLGIFGWPRDGDLASATYKIDLVPGPGAEDIDGQQGPLWDYWPVCYDPDHPPADATVFDDEAWGWGARGGLRLSAFIDEFGVNGKKSSICDRDFTSAMSMLGSSVPRRLENLCIDTKLMDVDPVTPGLQPHCRVAYRMPQINATTQVGTYVESAQSLPLCPPGATSETISADCWQLVNDKSKCPVNGQLFALLRTAAEIADGPLPRGIKIGAQCWACPDLASRPGCDY